MTFTSGNEAHRTFAKFSSATVLDAITNGHHLIAMARPGSTALPFHSTFFVAAHLTHQKSALPIGVRRLLTSLCWRLMNTLAELFCSVCKIYVHPEAASL